MPRDIGEQTFITIKAIRHRINLRNCVSSIVSRSITILVFITAGILLNLASFVQQTTAEWHAPLRLDSSNGNHVNPAYSPSGDLWVFYTTNDDVNEKLVRRKRSNGIDTFDDEAIVYDMAGRATQPLFIDADNIKLAVQDRDYTRLLDSSNGGTTWSEDRYWVATDSNTCAGYLPSFLTVDDGGFHLASGFTHNTGIFGCVRKLYFIAKVGNSWIQPATNLGSAGKILNVFEQGDEIVIAEERGVWRSDDNGTTFVKNSELNHSSGVTQDKQGNLYIIRSYSYGLPPNDYHLEIHRSLDFGLTWSSLYKLDADKHFFAPKLTVSDDAIVIVWASAAPGSGTFDKIHYIMSPNEGETWSAPEAIVTYSSGYETTSIENPFALVAKDEVVTLTYSKGNSYHPLGVYLMEWYGDNIPPQITPEPTTIPTPTPTPGDSENLKDLIGPAKKAVKKLPYRRKTVKRKETVAELKIFLGKIREAIQEDSLTLKQKKRVRKVLRLTRELLKAKTLFRRKKRKSLRALSRLRRAL